MTPARAELCATLNAPLSYSAKGDTPETVNGIRARNAGNARYCGRKH